MKKVLESYTVRTKKKHFNFENIKITRQIDKCLLGCG